MWTEPNWREKSARSRRVMNRLSCTGSAPDVAQPTLRSARCVPPSGLRARRPRTWIMEPRKGPVHHRPAMTVRECLIDLGVVGAPVPAGRLNAEPGGGRRSDCREAPSTLIMPNWTSAGSYSVRGQLLARGSWGSPTDGRGVEHASQPWRQPRKRQSRAALTMASPNAVPSRHTFRSRRCARLR